MFIYKHNHINNKPNHVYIISLYMYRSILVKSKKQRNTIMSFSIEDLDKALTHKNIIVSTYGGKDTLIIFKRYREIIINGVMYTIHWYMNECYLRTKTLTIPFRSVKQASTWPNGAKMNLQFYDKNSVICCILKIEEWEKNKEISKK